MRPVNSLLKSGLRPGKLLPLWVALALFGDPISAVYAPASEGFGTSQALADDDDDDGGDDDDDDGGSSSRGSSSRDGSGSTLRSGGPNLFRALKERVVQPRPRQSARRQASPPPPTRAENEIVATGLSAAEIGQLEADGFAVLDRSTVTGLGGSDLLRLRIPPNLSLEAARNRVAASTPQAVADFHHYYRTQEAPACTGPHCASVSLIDWPGHSALTAGCGGDIAIGLIDTAINPDHAAFAEGQVEVVRLSDGALPESGRQHGTAVAALLAGAADSRSPGLLPGARLVAVDAFYKGSRSDDRAGVYELLRALDLLDARGIQVTNMSLAGPPNALLEKLVRALSGDGMVIVAAAGNGGPSAAPLYPAAYPKVIAVTAVDRTMRPYRRAGRGDHIDLAAPGVDVWAAASVSGARPKSGTSFAAPFVTAAAALIKSSDANASSADIRQALEGSAQDLGAPGKDAVFGWGLLDVRGACEAAAKKT